MNALTPLMSDSNLKETNQQTDENTNKSDLKSQILEQLSSQDLIRLPNLQELHGAVLSLSSQDLISFKIETANKVKITPSGKEVIENGSPEFNFYSNVADEGNDLQNNDKIGYPIALKNKWIEIKNKKIFKKEKTVTDVVREELKSIEKSDKNSENFDQKALNNYKKRKLIELVEEKIYLIEKGPNYSHSTDTNLLNVLTKSMIQSGEYKNEFKKYNFKTSIRAKSGGLHPLRKVQTEIRKIFIELGFTEMETKNYVESSFWNFDVLFQPQNHTAREMHDTFFIKHPKESKEKVDPELIEKVKNEHEKSYLYDWKIEESKKNILRTHTTACSARRLYEIVQKFLEGKNLKELQPAKLFSIDRVFRNESVDATHLAEFHQVEGLVLGKNLTIGHLMCVLSDFFTKLGLSDIKFKPTYNPYTEPSLEVFAWHEGLGKMIEVGNSGIFRPEMLEPLGIGEEWKVIAWGLSLERPAMIKYGLNNIRELMGSKCDIEFIRDSSICWY